MTATCAWIWNEHIHRGEPVRTCPMPAREGSSLCVFHHRRSRRKVTKADRRQIEGVDEAA